VRVAAGVRTLWIGKAKQCHCRKDVPRVLKLGNAAVSFASKNEPCNGAVLVTGDVSIGVWNSSTRTFTATTSSPNAVQVIVRRDGTNTAAVSMSFAQLFGINSTKVTATSIAYYKTVGSKKNYSFVK